MSGCACPRSDARDCLRVRVGDDMRNLLGDPEVTWDDEVSCHEPDDDPSTWGEPPTGEAEGAGNG